MAKPLPTAQRKPKSAEQKQMLAEAETARAQKQSPLTAATPRMSRQEKAAAFRAFA